MSKPKKRGGHATPERSACKAPSVLKALMKKPVFWIGTVVISLPITSGLAISHSDIQLNLNIGNTTTIQQLKEPGHDREIKTPEEKYPDDEVNKRNYR